MWSANVCDCLRDCDLLCLCCYSLYCGCCAAGDVASAAGRDFCCSCLCFFVPLLGPWWIACVDRDALAAKLAIKDDIAGCCAFCIFNFLPGGAALLLMQELNEIRTARAEDEGAALLTQAQAAPASGGQPYYHAVSVEAASNGYSKS